MNKTIIKVPKDIRFLGDWEEFCLPNGIAILDKQITGCGFTEYCIKNNENIILCSPRKILLEDKTKQHIGEVYYIKNEYEKEVNIDKDLTAEKPIGVVDKEDNSNETSSTILDLHKRIELVYEDSRNKGIPCKILVTYDSFRHVKEVFTKLGILEKFRIVVDEFQSIFTDSKFKSTTEIEFLNHLNNLSNVCFVSATPMIEKYLDELDEFKDLPYFELDWESEQPGRVIKPLVSIKQYTSLTKVVSNIVNSYKDGNYDSAIIEIDGIKTKVYSKEAVFYVNSVKNICDIIKKNGLTLDNTNVLCARTDENFVKLKKAFGVKRGINVFGEVPTLGEPHKMFTLCTRTVYLGADFYSTNAKSYIFSDANIDSLAVDITLDLPQILGRQRLETNPWKNRADLYCKLLAKDLQKDPKEFTEYLNKKQIKTEKLLNAYNEVSTENKHELAETYQELAKSYNYKSNYIAVNKHAGSDLKPVFNKLVMLSEIRAFEIQQVDYSDRFRLFNSLKNSDKVEYDNEVANIIEYVDLLPYFNQKMRYLYCLDMSEELAKKVFDTLLDTNLAKYYYSVSKEKAGTLHYQRGELEKEYKRLISISATINLEDLPNEIYSNFKEGNKYIRSSIKSILQEIYDKLGYSKKAKASDLEEYFEVKDCTILNSETGKYDRGYNLIKKKD